MAQKNKALGIAPASRFVLWQQELLHLAAGKLQPAPHRVAHDKLMVCLEGALRLVSPEGQRIETRSCLIATGQWQDHSLIDCSQCVLAMWHLPAFSQDYATLASIMTSLNPSIHYGHPSEEILCARMTAVRDASNPDPQAIRRALREALIPPEQRGQVFRLYDSRVKEAVQHMSARLQTNLSIAELAAMINMSASYLEKLFKDQTALPIVQFRVRLRIFVATVLLAQGCSVTEAALKAGFASTSHFSRTFRALTGLTASALFGAGAGIRSVVDPGAARVVAQLTSAPRNAKHGPAKSPA